MRNQYFFLPMIAASLFISATAFSQVPPSSADTAPSRSHPTMALAVERLGGIAIGSFKPDTEELKVTTFTLGGPIHNPYAMPRVGFDYILPSGVTLGAAAAFGVYSATSAESKNGDLSAKLFMISPRIGYRVELSPSVDLHLRGGFSYIYGTVQQPDSTISSGTYNQSTGQYSYSTTNSKGDTLSGKVIALSLDPTLAIRLNPSVNFLIGAAYDTALSASGTLESTHYSGNRDSDTADSKGSLSTFQVWLGLGGYL